jgi:hypothetical protein
MTAATTIAISVMARLLRGISSVAIAATQFGTPTDCGRLGYSSAFFVIENSSAPVIKLAGRALILSRMTAVDAAPSECVMSDGHTAEYDDHGGGANFDKGSLHDATEGWLQELPLRRRQASGPTMVQISARSAVPLPQYPGCCVLGMPYLLR